MDQESDIDVMIPDQQRIIRQWAGFDINSATDADVLQSVIFGPRGETDAGQYTVQPWIKYYLGRWIAQEQITYEEFATALRYMYDVDKIPLN